MEASFSYRDSMKSSMDTVKLYLIRLRMVRYAFFFYKKHQCFLLETLNHSFLIVVDSNILFIVDILKWEKVWLMIL